ncbi:MAG: TonB-dependent receptor [Bacteroidetes bacterium]|jgi:iron complex outermembrane receptor protein|nr:TonB-dependent receptor [Bacteroidota bacterium]
MQRVLPPLLLSTLFLIACLMGTPVEVVAQTASISGTVQDADTGEPLSGANVLALRPGTTSMVAGSATDIDGNYQLTGLEPGSYDVVARFVGFQEQRQSVTLAAGEERTLNIEMVATGLDLNPVVVTASRRQEKSLDAPASVSVLEAQELVSDAAPSPAASLRYTPGVDIAQSGVDRYQISLRGFNSVFVAKTYALVDYRQTVAPSLGINAFASMPIAPIDLAQVEVVRGPGSALYGPGVEQGVIHFITKDPLNYPGTSVMIGGGQRSTAQGALRHAGIINNRLGYKVVGYYSQAQDWDFDQDDPADLQILCANVDSECTTDEQGNLQPVDLAPRPDDSEKYYAAGTLQYQFAPDVQLTGTGGYSSISQVNQANTGENVIEDFAQYYGQLRLQAGGLFAQAYYNRLDAGDTFFYRTGNPVVDESSQLSGQVQYSTSVLDGRQQFVGGIDYKQTIPRTGGTVHGRNEGDDTLTEYGAYLQSETDLTDQLRLTLTGRVDRDDVIEKTQFSPRAALVYRPVPEHSLRATFNRAFTTPAGVNLFLDLFVQDQGAVGVRGRGAADGWTFPDPIQTTSLITRQRNPGVGIPTAEAYAAVLQGLAESGALPDQLIQFLQGQLNAGAISGFLEGLMVIPGDETNQIVTSLNDLDPIDQTVTNSIELGYKGLIADRFLVGIDAYYTQKTNFLSELQLITPAVNVSNLPGRLGDAVASAFTDEQLAAFGLTPEALGQIFEQAAAQSSLAAGTVGVVETNENYEAGSQPELMLTYLNFGDVDYYGTDIAVQWLATDRVTVFGNYSWFSDNFFDAEELGEEPGSGRQIAMNAPQHKLSLGGEYSIEGGLSLRAAGRYVDEFAVSSGVYQGTVPSYFLLDLGAGYDFVRTVPGLRLDVTAQNVLDNEHRQYVGAPELGRLITARLTYTLR